MRRALRGLACAWALVCAVVVAGPVQAEESAEALPAGAAVPEMQASYSIPEALAQTVPWLQHIKEAAQAYGVDAHLLQAVVKVESNFDALAVSRSGAVGLMQIMPGTAMAVAGLRGTPQSVKQQLVDPAINVHAGALYLRSLMDTFAQRMDLALAAYNAGTGNVRKAGNRVPPNGETPKFVKKVTDLYASIKAAAGVSDAAQASKAAEASPIAAQPTLLTPQ